MSAAERPEGCVLGRLTLSIRIGDGEDGGIEVRSSCTGVATPALDIMALCELARLLKVGADELHAAAETFSEYAETVADADLIDMSPLAAVLEAYKEREEKA